MEERFLYPIGEVAEILGESVPVVRSWAKRYERFLKMHKNGKGNRSFYKEDLEVMKEIHFLVRKQGMSLSGAYDKIKEERHMISSKIKALDSLKKIKEQLEEIKSEIGNDK